MVQNILQINENFIPNMDYVRAISRERTTPARMKIADILIEDDRSQARKLYDRAMSATVGDFLDDQNSFPHRTSPARASQYTISELSSGLKKQCLTKEGFKELVKIGFFSTICYASLC
jgi:hypothetical protein